MKHPFETLGIHGRDRSIVFGNLEVIALDVPHFGRIPFFRLKERTGVSTRWKPFDCIVPGGIIQAAVVDNSRFAGGRVQGYGHPDLKRIGGILDESPIASVSKTTDSPREVNEFIGTPSALNANALYDQVDAFRASYGMPTFQQERDAATFSRALSAEGSKYQQHMLAAKIDSLLDYYSKGGVPPEEDVTVADSCPVRSIRPKPPEGRQR